MLDGTFTDEPTGRDYLKTSFPRFYNSDSKLTHEISLLDGMALAYRAHFALIRSPIYTSKGFNTSAIFGFTATLIELITKQKPSHLAVVFDTSALTERHRIHPEYKANWRRYARRPLCHHAPPSTELQRLLVSSRFKLDGYEADDIIGTLARRAEADGFDEIYMVTPDKDFGQLVTEKIKMYRPGRKGDDGEILGIKEIKENVGHRPRRPSYRYTRALRRHRRQHPRCSWYRSQDCRKLLLNTTPSKAS